MTTSTTASDWTPPGSNCGACGSRTCADFEALLRSGSASPEKCPFYNVNTLPVRGYTERRYSGKDILGQEYDFVITAMPGECSARKIGPTSPRGWG